MKGTVHINMVEVEVQKGQGNARISWIDTLNS